ncbi:FGGY-family carbohydrate kinase [Roseivirga pacifica]|uniref:FGGY-family carbohydrate kinase n=1 Tax=Roseivirga pacifica TaxID=1267423 RepID=UPI00227B7E8C|nr:FGGY family carbohydrate kinase [Roseivirga pacifica]
MTDAILVFDIGKTNKKCLVFDKHFNLIDEVSTVFPEHQDEDGFPCDDIAAITEWVLATAREKICSSNYNVEAINFSAYGATFVYIDKFGNSISPVYNYLKPLTDQKTDAFFSAYGKKEVLSKETSSPFLGMLNSGLQLYWLKYAKPEKYARLKYALHLPQYLSYLFTNTAISEYTSIGCHTMLWDFSKKQYHNWVNQEGINSILAPITNTTTCTKVELHGKAIKIGAGIHDSSSALLPYLYQSSEPFILLSTGTWNITLNPFEEGELTDDDLANDCLMFLGPEGQKVKAARLFMGKEHQVQVEKLTQAFNVSADSYKTVRLNKPLLEKLTKEGKSYFSLELTDANRTANWNTLADFETAYHQLIIELATLQIASIERAIGQTNVKRLFIDGGFVDNEIFLHLIRENFSTFEIIPAQLPVGSALGAALTVATTEQLDEWKSKQSKKVSA